MRFLSALIRVIGGPFCFRFSGDICGSFSVFVVHRDAKPENILWSDSRNRQFPALAGPRFSRGRPVYLQNEVVTVRIHDDEPILVLLAAAAVMPI